MKKWIVPGLWIALALSLIPITSDAAIRRVPARYNVVDFYAGYADPHGEYDEVGLVRFVDNLDRPVEVEADELFDAGWFFGFNYSSLYADRFLFQIGFRFIDYNEKDWFKSHPDEFHLRQYDVDFNLNLYPLAPTESFVAPYAGVGVATGLKNIEIAQYDDESNLTVMVAANFGVDLKVAQFEAGRSFLSLASVNSYDLFGSDDRPRHLNIGGAVRYWFR